MSNVVEILIRAKDQASQVFQNLANTGVASMGSIESSIDNATSTMENMSSTVDNMETSLQSAGETAENTGESINSSLEQAEENADSANRSFKDMFKNWESGAKKAGLAISATGVAVDVLAQKQATLTEDTHRLANVTDMTSKEMRQLAVETANVTFPIEDATALFETATQQGIRSGKAMKEYATYWDTLGDAVRGSGPELAKAGVSLQAIGIEAGNEKEALGAFGFVFQETTSSVEEFLSFIDKTGPELRSMGADINDSAAILGVLEKEFGMTGRTARQEFRAAVNESDGTMQGLLDTLGVSTDSFNQYKQQVKESSGVIQENADIHAESYTPLQKLKHQFDELTYTYGDQIQTLGNLSTVMMATGPLIQAVAYHQQIATAATKAWTVAQKAGTIAARAFAVAQTMALGPIGLIVAAIAAVIAIGYLLIKHWDTVKKVGIAVWEGIVQAAEFCWEMLKKGAINAFKILTFQWRMLYQALKIGFEWIKEVGPKLWEGIKNGAKTAFDFIKGVWTKLGDFLSSIFEGAIKIIKAPFNFFIDGFNKIINGLNGLNIKVPDWVPLIGGERFGFNIPNIPRLHTGGVFNAPTSGGEGLALLKDGEMVLDPMQSRKEAQNQGKSRPQIIKLIIDSRELAEIVANTMQDEIELRGFE
ncbi:phage tail tape measure protein [Virgibacillus sp. SK37]|uniref:phage tail tape measure protein n=1 Tax=Virgibacillus sp. SK37 TaxID=403957 RepID=UPI0004D0DF95|nr:phage tail tape measure protein [Virgibacillus sp. SK37]AIF45641.1 hypothetical protein X953_18795 [Virgibacillus sp. SK37]